MASNRQDGFLTSKSVVHKLKNDVNQFQTAVMSELQAIVARAESLGDSWRDEQYREFMNYIDELTTALKSDVTQLENAVAALDKEL